MSVFVTLFCGTRNMSPGEVKDIRLTDSMVILGEKWILSRNPLIRVAAYDTVQQEKNVLIQEIKLDEMERGKRIMANMPKRYG